MRPSERGRRRQYQARYGLTAPRSTGYVYASDPSVLADEQLVAAINARVRDGIVICRGGCTKASAVMDTAVVGMIEVT